MPFLDAALAFALTMLAVSTAAGQLLNLVRRVLGFRAIELKEMLDDFIANELQDVVTREMHRLSDRGAKGGQDPVRQTVSKFTAADITELLPEQLATSTRVSLSWTKQLDNVSTADLIEAAKRSKFGEELLGRFHDEADIIFQEIGSRWEQVGRLATTRYRARSRRWATLMGLLLAVALNIDSWFILDRYLHDRQMTAGVLAQVDDIQASADEAAAAVARTDSILNGLEGATGEDSTVLIGAARAIQWADIEEGFTSMSQSLERLEGSGLPLGFTYFPHSCWTGGSATATGGPGAACEDDYGRNLFTWVLGIALTGLLSGLGAPFWHDVVRGVSRVRRSSREATPA